MSASRDTARPASAHQTGIIGQYGQQRGFGPRQRFRYLAEVAVGRGGNPLDIAISGLRANRVRMDVISANIANAFTTRTSSGGPYRRQSVTLSTEADELGGVEITGVEGFARSVAIKRPRERAGSRTDNEARGPISCRSCLGGLLNAA